MARALRCNSRVFPAQLAAQAHQLIVNGAAVGLDLRLAGAADKAQAPALAFKVGPGAHQPRALVAECGHFHLQDTFAGARAVREDLEDEPGAVEDLDPPVLFQIALLDGCHGAVDEDEFDLFGLQTVLQFGDLALAEKMARLRAVDPDEIGTDHVKIGQRMGKCHALFQRRSGWTPVRVFADVRVKHPGAGAPAVTSDQDASSPS